MTKLLCALATLIIGLTSNSLIAQSGWTPQTNPLDTGKGIIGEIQFVSPTEGWINATIGPKLLHTTNSGSDWSVVTMFPNDTVRTMSNPCINISFINPTMGWVIKGLGINFPNFSGGVVYKTTDGGNTWQRNVISQNAGELGLQIQFVDANNGWASVVNVNTNVNTLYKSSNGGNNWSLVSTGSFGIFNFVDVNNGWAITIGQNMPPPYQILQTTNGGANWTIQFTDNTQGGFNAIQFTDLNNGWIVGENGKILRTTNGGTNWNYITTSGINSYYTCGSLYFLNTNVGWIGTKDTSSKTVSVLHTTDNGSSWTQQYPSTSGSSIYSIHFYDTLNGGLTSGQGIIYHTNTGGVVSVSDRIGQSPKSFQLSQNYPNPFNPITKIQFAISSAQFVTLKIYDLLGREITTITNEHKQAGNHEVEFNGNNLSSGVYYYRIQAGNFSETKKLVLIR